MRSFFQSKRKKKASPDPASSQSGGIEESRGPERTFRSGKENTENGANGNGAAAAGLMTQVDKDGNQIIQEQQEEFDEDLEMALCTCDAACLPFWSRFGSKKGNFSASEPSGPEPGAALLEPVAPEDEGKICLVLDLDETLVHGSLEPIDGPDLVVPCVLNQDRIDVFIRKRPGVERFLAKVGDLFEVVVYTASMGQYASKVVAEFDTTKQVKAELYRESCILTQRGYVKDLSRLRRDLSRTIIIDNSHESVMFQPENAIVCVSFFTDPDDIELDLIGDFLESIKDVKDVRQHLHKWEGYRVKRLNELGRDAGAADDFY